MGVSLTHHAIRRASYTTFQRFTARHFSYVYSGTLGGGRRSVSVARRSSSMAGTIPAGDGELLARELGPNSVHNAYVCV